MSDDEYDDELPPISVNTSFSRDSELLRMPTAEEVAIARAREAECERELLALRASDTDVCLHTADSSGSEGETALLAASVTALQVKVETKKSRTAQTSLADLLAPMLSRLPQDCMTAALSESLRDATPSTLAALTQDVCEAVETGQVPSWEESSCAAAWLCAASVGATSRGLRCRSRRALHGLLENSCFADPDGEASCALKNVLIGGELDPHVRIELADSLAAARSTARLHRRLLLLALADLLHCAPQPEWDESCSCAWAASAAAAAWARLAARAAGAAVRAAARLVRACAAPPRCAPHRASLLATMAAAAPAARTAPDRLEVIVAASKLQLIFNDQKHL